MHSLVSASFLYLHFYIDLVDYCQILERRFALKLGDSFTNSTAVIWGLNVPHNTIPDLPNLQNDFQILFMNRNQIIKFCM